MIADTSFLIDMMMNEPKAVSKAKEIEHKGSTILVCSPSVFELYVGVALSLKPEDEKTKIIDLIGSLPQLSLDFESACVVERSTVSVLRLGSKSIQRTL